MKKLVGKTKCFYVANCEDKNSKPYNLDGFGNENVYEMPDGTYEVDVFLIGIKTLSADTYNFLVESGLVVPVTEPVPRRR